jgi:hypothetical protein
MGDNELDEYCHAWREWCRTRKFYIAPGAKNILARMQPDKVRQPPNADLCQDMSYFHAAVHALADIDEDDADCFVQYYFFKVKNIKAVAYDMKISRDTFYERKKRFAKRALSMSRSLKEYADNLKPDDVAMALMID